MTCLTPVFLSVFDPRTKPCCLLLHKFNFLGVIVNYAQSVVLPFFLFVCLKTNIDKSCVRDVFSKSPLNTETRIIRTIWHVPLVSALTIKFRRTEEDRTKDFFKEELKLNYMNG